MTDYERRGDGPRGRFNNRKRRYRDDDDYDRRPQRRRYEEPLVVKVKKQLLAFAETPAHRVEDEIVRITKLVSDNAGDQEIRTVFLDLVLQLVVEQPLKIPFIAGVVLSLNLQKPDLVEEVLAKAGKVSESYLEVGSWREFKLVLRFLGCLQGIFLQDGIFPTLDELFSRAVDLQTSSSEDSLGLEIVKIILLSLPYVMTSSATGFETQAASLLEKTDIIASTPHALETLVDPYPGNGNEKHHESPSFISLLQKQLQQESANDWEIVCLPRIWKFATKTPDAESLEKKTDDASEATADKENAEKLDTSEAVETTETTEPTESAEIPAIPKVSKHMFPTINVPNPVVAGPYAIFPEVFLSVYLDQEVETVPPLTDIASSLVRDALVDTINVLDINRNIAARFLIDVDCYFASEIFVKRGTSFDKMREMKVDRPAWKPEDVAVDAVFGELLKLPNPEHKLVYYHSVLTEACKIAPAAIAPSLGRAIRYLYRNLEMMDQELGFRFMDWFTHHLSNFGFTWKWTEWVGDTELSNLHPRKAFMIAALDKEARLSFAQRIRGTLPEPYHSLIPKEKEQDIPDFKYASEQASFNAEATQIANLIRKKAPDVDIEPVMKEIETLAAQHGVSDVLVPSTDAFVTSICFVGAKSLSHVLSCIERNKDRLLAIGPQSAAARRQICSSVINYWSAQPGVGVNIVDKLLNYTILTPQSVIDWALEDTLEGGRGLARSFAYEMVSATIGKVTTRVRQIIMARNRIGLPPDQIAMLDETLKLENEAMKKLFKAIENAVAAVERGEDRMKVEGGVAEDEERWIKWWGEKWGKVFKRKEIVEEAWAAEREVERKREEAKAKAQESAKEDADANVIVVEDVDVDEPQAVEA